MDAFGVPGGGGVAPPGRSTLAGAQHGPWRARLRRALDARDFVLHYQPIVSLADGTVAHHEALVRLADRDDGSLVAPARFLPAAERSGLVKEIDRIVLDMALATFARRHAGETVAINVSALSVTDPRMLGYVRERLAHHGLPGRALVLELTETASISDMRAAREFCSGAHALGCAIALDDFGAGFGSLQYLKQLPFRYLKIDGGFIRSLARSRSDRLVVKALVELARGMGARTIAEYAADEHTVELLRGLDVDFAQGFALGRPRPLPASGGEAEIRARTQRWKRGATSGVRAA
jgi:EAL domain-containing protein (putative c-di-GMP-specific phosphodiesterase class I)